MSKKHFNGLATVSVALLLLWGIARTGAQVAKQPLKGKPEPAAMSRYEERLRAIRTEFEAERKRLGLDVEALKAKYPTPEITLCRRMRAIPGGTAEVVTRGKFAPGTRFLLENDNVEVVQETVTASEYRAKVRVAPNVGPGVASVHAVTPVSPGDTQCSPLYIGGKYEWDFTADNGWRIKLRMVDERLGSEETQIPRPLYRAEFYRGDDTSPFETRDMELSLESSLRGSYYGGMQEPEADTGGAMAEIEKLTQKMADPNLSDAEQDRLEQRLNDLIEKMSQEQTSPDYGKKMERQQAEMERKRQEFGCHSFNFRLKPGGVVEGDLTCGSKVGTLKYTGTMKFLGP